MIIMRERKYHNWIIIMSFRWTHNRSKGIALIKLAYVIQSISGMERYRKSTVISEDEQWKLK